MDVQIKLFDAMLEAECTLFIIRAALKRTNLADRLAKEAAEKAEAERLAKEAAEKAETDRLAKEAAEKAEAEHLLRHARQSANHDQDAADIHDAAAANKVAAPAVGAGSSSMLESEEDRQDRHAQDDADLITRRINESLLSNKSSTLEQMEEETPNQHVSVRRHSCWEYFLYFLCCRCCCHREQPDSNSFEEPLINYS